jgi:hypothetical protein
MAFTDDKAIAINSLIDAVEAIETELGIAPSGVYTDMRARLDILEARLGSSPIVKQTVTGSKGGNVALASLITALVNLGLITDTTT